MTTGFTHESPHNETVEWYTPPTIFEALGGGRTAMLIEAREDQCEATAKRLAQGTLI